MRLQKRTDRSSLLADTLAAPIKTRAHEEKKSVVVRLRLQQKQIWRKA